MSNKQSIELKIKYKTLTAEAQFIRLEKRKAKARRKTDLVRRLHEHKLDRVRPAARSTHLAQCFLRGTEYKAVEQKLKPTTPEPNWSAIETMVKKYGSGDSRVLMQKFAEWTDSANK